MPFSERNNPIFSHLPSSTTYLNIFGGILSNRKKKKEDKYFISSNLEHFLP